MYGNDSGQSNGCFGLRLTHPRPLRGSLKLPGRKGNSVPKDQPRFYARRVIDLCAGVAVFDRNTGKAVTGLMKPNEANAVAQQMNEVG